MKFHKTIQWGAFILIILCHSAMAQKVWKIMPVGNSITAGLGSANGYGFRDDLANKLTGAGISFELVGSDGSPYNGHFLSGIKIEDLLPGGIKDISSALSNYQPNIILLHIGTNNLTNGIAPYSNDRGITYENTASGKLATLLRYLTQYSNGTKGSFLERVLVCKIIPRYDNSVMLTNVALYNAEIERMFFENPPFAKMTLVDMYSILSKSDLVDERHPNDAGYAKMAAEYANIINGVIRTDTIAPGDPVSMVIQPMDAQTAGLQWIVSGDDGGLGRANLYELRYSTFQLTDKNFSQGKLVPLSRPSSSGAIQTKSVDKLVSGLTYFFGLRVYDEWNNRSNIRFFSPVRMEGTPGYLYCDDFSNATLPNWSVAPGYEVDIVEGDLRLRSSAQPLWEYLATYTGARYNNSARSVKASMEWSGLADKNGMHASGVAMLMDSPNYTANGYLIRLRNGVIYLNQIRGGVLQSSEIQKYTSPASNVTPLPGDSLSVRYFPGGVYGHTFDVYLNKTYLGQLYDKNKVEGNADQLYSGVMLYGGNLSNAVTKFCLEIPPLAADSMQIFVGNQQRGQITQRLAEPLTVKVVDANGIAVSDVQIEFSVNSGQAFLSTDSLANTFNGNLWMEAEKGELTNPYTTGNAIEASGSEYIYVPQDINREKGVAKYQFYNVRAGQYRLWLRVNAQDGSHNSCFFSVNASDTLQFDFSGSLGIFAWYYYANRTFYLPQGFFNFAIKNRESNTRIDKILLTSNLAYTPQTIGSTTQRFSNLTDNGGLGYTFVTFTTAAGPVQVKATAPTVPNGSPQTFTIYADALDPKSMTYASERVLSDTVGQLMSQSFSVVMKDQYNNSCVGIPVDFIVTEGDGNFGGHSSIRVSSNSNGIAAARMTLGYSSAGSKIKAQLVNSPEISPLTFEALPDKEGIPIEIVAVKGHGQQGVVHQALNDSLIVQVLDRNGRPVYKYPVPFKISKGNGSFNGLGKSFIDSTSIYGKAHARFMLGDTAGVENNIVTIDVPLNGAPIVFKATALADKPSFFKVISGDQQAWYAGETFPKPLMVKLSDKYGNGHRGYGVKFSILPESGNGNFKGQDTLTVATDSLGIAQVFFNAGNQEGINRVQAQVSSKLNIAPVTFANLLVKPPKPNRILEVSGNYQEGVVDQVLAQPFKVKVIDPFGNFMPGVNLIARVMSGGGKLDGADSTALKTDAAGLAEITLQVGRTSGYGNQVVRIRCLDYQLQPVEFIATALAGVADRLAAVGDLYFSEKAEVQAPIQIMVKDLFGNPKPGHQVTFSITEGNGSFEQGGREIEVTTNQSGIAMANYKMGTQATVDNVILVSAAKTDGQPLADSPITFVGRVIAGSPSQLLAVQEREYSGKILTTLTDPMVAEVRDAYGNSVQQGTLVHFKVIAGGGSFGDAEEIDQATDENGQARAYLRLGAIAGMNNNLVIATVPDFPQIKSVQFSASALADEPDRIYADGDSVFIGKVKTEFTPRVVVTDLRGNAIANFPVLFKVMAGTGKLRSSESSLWQDTVSVRTNLEGKANVRWQFGAKPDSNRVNAYAHLNNSALVNSPVKFRGLATAEEAQYLVRVSALTDTGVVYNPLANPLIVQVTDKSGNAVANHSVLFEVIYPSATEGPGKLYTLMNMSDTTSQKTIKTDQQGLARAYFLLSKKPGPNFIKVTSRFAAGGQFLFGSPINLHIEGLASPAKRLVLLSPSTLTGAVHSNHLISAKAIDGNGKPVAGHPIQFKLLEEKSTLNGTADRWITVNTSSDGIASCQWTLGSQAGVDQNLLEISSPPLENSPFTLKATVTPGSVSSLHSTIITTLDSVLADNVSLARVTAVLMDSFFNVVKGTAVTFTSADEGVQFYEANTQSDADGQAVGRVKSFRSGVKTVSAQIVSESPFTLCCTAVTFLAGQPAKLRVHAGDGPIGNVGTALKDSLAVQVLDAMNNPIPRAVVQFAVHSGGGYFRETMKISQNDTTDAVGIARVFLVLGKQANLDNVVYATIGSLQTVLTCKTRTSSPTHIYKYEERTLQAAVASELEPPLIVRVEDDAGNPVWNAAVLFSPLDSTAAIMTSNPTRTDYRGLAQARYYLGRKAGDQYVIARLSGTPASTTFIVQAIGKNPHRISAVSGQDQQGRAGNNLPEPFIVRVADEYGNGVADAAVTFRLVEGKGATIVGPDTVHTDAQGMAQGQAQLGFKSGEYGFFALSPLLPGQAELFSCTALADVAFKLDRPGGSLAHDNQQMTVSRELLYPVMVLVRDKYDNPVKNELVQFAIVENNGYLVNPRVVSDDSGRVYGRWVLGKTPGRNKIMAYRLGLFNSPITFTATGVINNYPEFYDLPSYEQTIEYNKPLSFAVTAKDLDNDPLHYRLKIKPNPTNAVFDSINTQLFQWTPGVRQKGTYKFLLSVWDDKGGLDIDSLLVKVVGDSAPVITSLYPPCGMPLSLSMPDSMIFSCAAVDYDGDPLTFRWFVNDRVFEGARFVFHSKQFNQGNLRIHVQVSDGQKTTKSCEWTLLLTHVELSTFQAQFIPFTGIRLNWQTFAEFDNAGFEVLRSRNQHNDYQRITNEIIPRRNDGTYVFVDSTALAGDQYYYQLQDISLNGSRTCHGPIKVELTLPEQFKVYQNYPNPFNPETRIRFQLPSTSHTRVAIFNTVGQLVRLLVDKSLTAGYHESKWDGRDQQGVRVSSGVYYYRIEAGRERSVKKMVLLK